jgi:hypothetical protein
VIFSLWYVCFGGCYSRRSCLVGRTNSRISRSLCCGKISAFFDEPAATMTWADRLFLAAASRFMPRERWRSFVGTAATLLRSASALDGKAFDVRALSRAVSNPP